jgi:TonB family protein
MRKFVLSVSISLAIAGCSAYGGPLRVAPPPADFKADSPCAGMLPTTHRPPRFPIDAARNRQSGWVTVTFDITPAGAVTNLAIADSSPPGIFEANTLAAIQQWHYAASTSGHTGCKEFVSFTVNRM